MAAPATSTEFASLTANYRPSSVKDELVSPDGAIADHWGPVLAGLARLSPDQRQNRLERLQMRVRETGIAHDLFADPSRTAQPWRIDLVPVALNSATWAEIEAAVIQRARLAEAILADLYGARRLLGSGFIPPKLLFSDPTYLRACHGLPAGQGRLQFFAVDFVRASDGSWRVVDTHAETPAGIGYALANRMVYTHVCGDIFAAAKAVRLAQFFRHMQTALARRSGRADPRVALLTPGPRHDDFFSHAYLARYLGLLIVEGRDLRIDQGGIFLKTVDGLQQVDLLVRCISGAQSDALELDPTGFLGPIGLVQAVRDRPDIVVNELGTALVENRGLGPLLPALCEELLGEPLKIYDIVKWWLGDRNVAADVIANLDSFFIRRAHEQTARPGHAARARDPALMTLSERKALIEEIKLDGTSLIAEAKTAISTTPSYGPDGLRPKPFGLRVFACAMPGGSYEVMPGGLAMSVDPAVSVALTAPNGETHDVWVLSDKSQPPFKSLWRPVLDAAQVQRTPRELPSQAADNLFWLGRYVEGVDWSLRVVKTGLGRIEEDNGPRQGLRIARAMLELLLSGDAEPAKFDPAMSSSDEALAIAHLSRRVLAGSDRPGSLQQSLLNIHRIAGLTRDRLSLEAWRTLNAFFTSRRWHFETPPASNGEFIDLIDYGLSVVASFNGLTHENMTRNFGWSFLDIGRRISRAFNLSLLLLTAFREARSDGEEGEELLYALEVADSFITYRSRYRLDPIVPLVLDLLIADESNPRSLAFQLVALHGHIEGLPQAGEGRARNEVQKLSLSLLDTVRLADVNRLAEVDNSGARPILAVLLRRQLDLLPELSDALTRRYFSVIEKAPHWGRGRTRRAP